MTIVFEYFEKDAYLLATISDKVINSQRAKSIFESIDTECQKFNCRKVLLNELTLEKRKIANHELRSISDNMPNVRLAFLCKPELIDHKAKLFSAFTYADEYVAKHFSAETEAIKWLLGPLNC